jgi:DNA-binding MarR family transcriptional regulator
MVGKAPREKPDGRSRRLVLDDFLPYRLNVLASLTSDGVARLYSAQFGLTIPEWRVLATLGERDSTTAKFIGEHSQMHKTKVSRAVADMIRRGLIKRQTNRADLREAFLTLTATGRATYERIVPLALAYQAELIDGLSEDDLRTVDRAIEILTTRSRNLLAAIRRRSGEE